MRRLTSAATVTGTLSTGPWGLPRRLLGHGGLFELSVDAAREFDAFEEGGALARQQLTATVVRQPAFGLKLLGVRHKLLDLLEAFPALRQ
jgi:hypothetical protein